MTSRAAGGALLAARAGVGKTRLARDAVQLAEESGFVTTWVAATQSASTLPLAAFGPALPPAPADVEVASADRIDLLRRTMAALLARAVDGRLALFVDDAHHLDDMSATPLHQVALTRRAFIVATVRTGEHAPDPVVALWKDDLVERIDLKGLSEQAAGELLAKVLGGEVDPSASVAMVRSGGVVTTQRNSQKPRTVFAS
jgi:hypothetical protein